jgi:predicted MFS family arabinose efflux permease
MDPRARRRITAALLGATFLASLEVVIVGPAMPAVVRELGGARWYPWLFSTYALAQTLSTPLWGALADRVGRRDAFLAGIGLFLAGCCACASAPDTATLVAARLVQGLGAGAILPITLTLFGDLYPVAERTRLQGVFSFVWGLSSLAGPLLGGALTDTLGWRSVFAINLPPGLIAVAVIARAVPRALGRGGQAAEGPFAGMALLLRDRTQQAITAAGLGLGAALLGVVSFTPLWVQGVRGGTSADAGLHVLPMSLCWTAAAAVAGRLIPARGDRFTVRVGAVLVAVGTAGAAVVPASVAGLAVFGAGMGLLVASFTVAGQEAAPLALRGQASALGLFARGLGGAVAVPLLGVLVGFGPEAAGGSPNLEAGLGRAFFAVAACAAAAAAVVFWRFPATRR